MKVFNDGGSFFLFFFFLVIVHRKLAANARHAAPEFCVNWKRCGPAVLWDFRQMVSALIFHNLLVGLQVSGVWSDRSNENYRFLHFMSIVHDEHSKDLWPLIIEGSKGKRDNQFSQIENNVQ